jgi:predicted RNase H-like nuclease
MSVTLPHGVYSRLSDAELRAVRDVYEAALSTIAGMIPVDEEVADVEYVIKMRSNIDAVPSQEFRGDDAQDVLDSAIAALIAGMVLKPLAEPAAVDTESEPTATSTEGDDMQVGGTFPALSTPRKGPKKGGKKR